jgi:hypothetical protein
MAKYKYKFTFDNLVYIGWCVERLMDIATDIYLERQVIDYDPEEMAKEAIDSSEFKGYINYLECDESLVDYLKDHVYDISGYIDSRLDEVSMDPRGYLKNNAPTQE